MGKSIRQEVKQQLEYLKKALKKAKSEMEVLPCATLRCSSSNGCYQFFIDGKYVSKKNMDLVQAVAQREYYEKLIPVLESSLEQMMEVQNLYEEQLLENCYEELCSARKELVTPIIDSLDKKIHRFMAENYERGEFKEEDRSELYTIKGERVRSKSELIIADELYRYHIPYHYEKPLILEDWGNEIVVRPDFTVMNPSNGKIYIYEHMGMMDNLAYVEKNMRKLDLYEKNGYILGKNLIVTHETSKMPLVVGVVDSYIENFLM